MRNFFAAISPRRHASFGFNSNLLTHLGGGAIMLYPLASSREASSDATADEAEQGESRRTQLKKIEKRSAAQRLSSPSFFLSLSKFSRGGGLCEFESFFIYLYLFLLFPKSSVFSHRSKQRSEKRGSFRLERDFSLVKGRNDGGEKGKHKGERNSALKLPFAPPAAAIKRLFFFRAASIVQIKKLFLIVLSLSDTLSSGGGGTRGAAQRRRERKRKGQSRSQVRKRQERGVISFLLYLAGATAAGAAAAEAPPSRSIRPS
jgi:hypothetical protein